MMPSPSPLSTERGVSLLEVILAVIIISIVASILIISSRTAVTGQTRSKVYGDAATAAKEGLESIRLIPLDSIRKLNNTPLEHSQGAVVTVRATARRLEPADVGDIAALDTATLRHVTLLVGFKNQAGGTSTKTFTTIVYKP